MKNRNVDHISIRGYSHLLSNKECQDSSISWRGKKYSAVIISDGHGGEKYFRSAKGSEIIDLFFCLRKVAIFYLRTPSRFYRD